jgi:hypothetical protein
MSAPIECPVCKNAHGGIATSDHFLLVDRIILKCDLCGSYEVETALIEDGLKAKGKVLTATQRAALTHVIRKQNDGGKRDFKLTISWLEENVESLKLPSAAQQAANAIRFIGDQITEIGDQIGNLADHFFASIGSFNRNRAQRIVFQLKEQGVLIAEDAPFKRAPNQGGNTLNSCLMYVDLNLKGWELYEAGKRGKFAGNYGFIAMQFGDEILDPFVKDVLKPIVKAKLKIEVVDMRDSSKSGVIDNIMRECIRDSKFVLVDLTHENSGAYWEAGYAEGLGKPVIYLCERTKFEEEKTHFDTNHCTTVMWSKDGDNQKFEDDLISTLRRSLNMFE